MPGYQPAGRIGHWRFITEAGIGCRLWINEPPDIIQADIDRIGTFYETPALRLIHSLLPPNPRIVDVGANFGNHSVYFSRICNASWLLPLEPNPEVIPELRANLAANGCSAELSYLGVAVGAQRGELHLRLDPADAAIRNRGGTRLVESAADATGGRVPIVPLDEIVTGEVDFIKIDVEGMGVQVLQGAASVIARCAPLIFIEVGVDEMPAFFDWLRGASYRVGAALSDYVGLTNMVLQPTASHPGAVAGPADDAEARVAEALGAAAAAQAHAARADATAAAALAKLEATQRAAEEAADEAGAAVQQELRDLRDEVARLRRVDRSLAGRIANLFYGGTIR